MLQPNSAHQLWPSQSVYIFGICSTIFHLVDVLISDILWSGSPHAYLVRIHFNRYLLHTVRFHRKYGHFCPAFRDKIDKSFLRFFILTLVLLDWLDLGNSSTRSLVWENERNCWEMFTSSLRSHKFKSGNISGKIRQCVSKLNLIFTKKHQSPKSIPKCALLGAKHHHSIAI